MKSCPMFNIHEFSVSPEFSFSDQTKSKTKGRVRRRVNEILHKDEGSESENIIQRAALNLIMMKVRRAHYSFIRKVGSIKEYV